MGREDLQMHLALEEHAPTACLPAAYPYRDKEMETGGEEWMGLREEKKKNWDKEGEAG